MNHTPSPNVPRCSACGARHYPATTGAGALVWCDGSPVDSHAEQERAARVLRAEHERAACRARIRAEREQRADTPPIESWESERARVPDTLPLEF